MEAPLLERNYEIDLARRWREQGDETALDELITSHIRLVVRIAAGFKGYGLPLGDLIQEGNVGLLEAANRFDIERKVRFSTYATWWILAAVQEYIVRNATIVRIGTTPAQKSLFFNLRRMRAKLTGNPSASMTEEHRQEVARRLRVPQAAVQRMEAHLSHSDRSLNAAMSKENSDEFQDFLPDPGPSPEELVAEWHDGAAHSQWLSEAMGVLTPRERQVVSRRFLEDGRTTLAEIGETFGVTKERVRQIEGKALSKLRQVLGEKFDAGEIVLN